MDADGEQCIHSDHLSVEDVYDYASIIGKEFEVIIDVWGSEVVSKLMPKVITVLETLEYVCLQKQAKDCEVNTLLSKIRELEKEKHAKAEHRVKFETEVEQAEEVWRSENLALNEMVKKLKDDNLRLQSALSSDSSFSDSTLETPQEDDEQTLALKERLKRYKSQIEQLINERDCKALENDKIREQLQKSSHQVRDLKRQLRQMEVQNRIALEEKSDLQAHIEDQNRQIAALKEKLGVTIKENIDLSSASSESDKEAPRFSLTELRSILFERNALKSRVRELEDELASYKNLGKKSSPVVSATSSPKNKPSEDLPVHGPINREPDEKLFPDRKRNSILK
ncbi:RILP-like protein [Dinothrombium tinctorium]|uniref:RILP-like protein n=1 Tax=Dinothrombium tinctorium TaxID=1965070 RepID=A0A443R141_9ACAR|nr:RILP-like protein [Dinothrombium tinctorium]